MNNFIVRTLTGIVFVAVMVGGMLYSSTTLLLLFLAITVLSVWEFTGIVSTRNDIQVNRFITTAASAFLYLAFTLVLAGHYYDFSFFAFMMLLIPCLLLNIYIMVEELFLRHSNPLNNWAMSMLAQIYVALPFALLVNFSYFFSPPSPDNADAGVYMGGVLPLSVFLFLWCNDTGAYLCGSLVGKHKLFPRISPGKTWEGSVGGGMICVALSQALAHYSGFFSPAVWAGFALVVVVFGTLGDLVESLLKRHLGIKDSGKLLPGHGGMLDRFDSSLIAIPASFAFLALTS